MEIDISCRPYCDGTPKRRTLTIEELRAGRVWHCETCGNTWTSSPGTPHYTLTQRYRQSPTIKREGV